VLHVVIIVQVVLVSFVFNCVFGSIFTHVNFTTGLWAVELRI
jgi:hypothetical protein